MLFLILFHVVHLASFSKAEYYKIIAGKEVGSMTLMIEKLEQNSENPEHMAYLGALLMRKSAFLRQAKAKLDLFKEGKRILENAIAKDMDNAEYRFLRLMIQEHAPGILNYNHQVASDAKFILKEYEHLPTDVKAAILSYAKNSPSLKNLHQL